MGWLALDVHAQATPVTTWAVRVADDSRCRESPGFATTLAAEIPQPQRARPEEAELLANVTLREDGLARVQVWDRILQAEAGARELQVDAADCDNSAEALALVIGVLVEAGRGAPAPAPPPPVEPPPAPPPASPPPRARAPSSTRYAWLGPRAGHDVHAALGVAAGLLPGPAPLLTVGWGIRGAKAWPVWLEGTASRRDAHNVQFTTGYASLLTCPLSGSWRTLRGRACAGGSVGMIRSEGHGLFATRVEKRPLYLLGIELGASVPLAGPLEFTLLGRVDLVPVRQRFVYERRDLSEQTLYQVKVMTTSLCAGLALRFR